MSRGLIYLGVMFSHFDSLEDKNLYLSSVHMIVTLLKNIFIKGRSFFTGGGGYTTLGVLNLLRLFSFPV